MVEGRRERQQLTPPSEGTGSLPLSICRTEPRPSITGRVSGRTRACVTYASSPHHLTRHATTYRELPPRSNSTNLAALHTVFVATHQVSAVDETLCAGSGTLTRAVAVVTAPPTANDSRKYASICKNRFFSGFLGDCAVEKFLKNTEGSCKLNELVSVAANNRLHRNIEEVENLNEPEEARLMAGFFRSTRLQRNKQVQKRNLSAIAHQIYKKRTFTRPNSQKRTRNVFTRLNNYSRTRSADGFDGSTARTGQNGKLSHQKTVNGTRNSFADREALAGFGVRPRFKVRRTAQGCKGVSPLAHDCKMTIPVLCTIGIVPVF